MSEEMAVEMKHICKKFGGVYALNDACFELRRGEVHALMGENGAGKSTLMKILSGAYTKDAGEIYINGEKVEITNPKAARKLGISTIYQEFALAKDLTVTENIFIDNLGGGSEIIHWKKMYQQARELLKKLGFSNINVKDKVEDLSVAYQQVVEIAKALSREAKVIIFDEPTAVLTAREVEQLFRIINELKAEGVAIVYISHRLEEIFRMCDRITVLKDGKYVTTVKTCDITEDELVTKMIGRELNGFFPERNAKITDVALKVENLNAGKAVKNVSFEVRKGEILGINGLVGAGRTETMRAVFGADKKDSGKVYLFGQEVQISTPKHAVRAGLGMLPEDRKNDGVLLHMPIKVNVTLASTGQYSNRIGKIKRKKEIDHVNQLVQELRIKIGGIDHNVSTLSGGNQQKVALSKWLASNCKVLILDEPTRGVDVGAKVEIYKIMNRLAEEGTAIIMISSEMPEIIGMSDRVLVMREGELVGELQKDELVEESLIKYAMGVTQ
ncbi:MAG: sugar ABC transporter ATP-binding protein [Blautia sp.]